MPLNVETNHWATVGDGATTVFAYTNKILAAGDLDVYLDGVLQVSGFTVAGAGAAAGGTVTFSTAPGELVDVVLHRGQSTLQPGSYKENNEFGAAATNTILDRLAIGIQQLANRSARSLRLADGDPEETGFDALPAKADLAGNYLYFDEDGNPQAAAGISDVTISGAMEPVVTAATVAAGRLALGISAAMDAVVTAASLAAGRLALGISAAMDGVVTATTVAAARAALGLVIGTDVLAPSGDGTGLSGILTKTGTRVPFSADTNIATPTHAGATMVATSADPKTLTLQKNSTHATPVGFQFAVLQKAAGQVTVAAGAGVTLNIPDGKVAKCRAQNSWASVWKDETDVWYITGDLEDA